MGRRRLKIHDIEDVVSIREFFDGLTDSPSRSLCLLDSADQYMPIPPVVPNAIALPPFRHRIQAIVEKFSDMHEDLQKERKMMTRLWAKREEQLRGAIESTAGMYGDLQGIAGKTLQETEGLEVPLLEIVDSNIDALKK